MELIDEHVARFNAGVRSGDYGPMLEQFTEDAELAFQGVPVGPFVGVRRSQTRTASGHRTTSSTCSRWPRSPAGWSPATHGARRRAIGPARCGSGCEAGGSRACS